MSITEFKQSMMMVNSLIDLEGAIDDPPADGDLPKSSALRASAVILMVSCFENFIKSEIKNLIIEINKTIASDERRYVFERLPANMRKEHYFKIVRNIIDSGMDEDKISDIRDVYLATYAKRLNSEMFSNLDANPGPESLKRAYRRIGISDIFSYVKHDFDVIWKKPEVDDYIQEKLQEIIDARNLVAHTAKLNISRKDLQEYRNFIDVVSESLSVSLHKYLTTGILLDIDSASRK